jgi:hypothetical protein
MTYFLVPDLTVLGNIYFVPDEETVEQNNHLICYVGGLEKANNRLVESRTAYLAQEDYRFTIAKEIVDGNNTTWINADLENDSEEGIYQVFNTITGLHEQVSGLTNAKNRRDAIKQEFLTEYKLDSVTVVTELPKKPQILGYFGVNLGPIPLEII